MLKIWKWVEGFEAEGLWVRCGIFVSDYILSIEEFGLFWLQAREELWEPYSSKDTLFKPMKTIGTNCAVTC
jgi:hypothetical protein